MADDPIKLDSDIDIRRAEYLLKRDEIRINERNNAKAWQKVIFAPLIVAIIAATLSGASSFYVEKEKIKSSGENGKFAREHALLLAAENLDRDQRKDRLCQYSYSNAFQHPDSRDILEGFIASNPDCTISGIIASEEIEIANNQLERCINSGAVQTASCRAYDKSGFHSKPNASCNLSLHAGDGRFFANNRVVVVDEFYRRLVGPSAQDAVNAVGNIEPIRSFEGRIRCTNSAGTGRTCEARATIQLPSYPDECLGYVEQLSLL